MKQQFISLIFLGLLILCSGWGFFAHKRINQLAVFTLPTGLSRFYKLNIDYIKDHAVDPDKRRYADTLEAPRHYLDVENYEENIDSIPRSYEAAEKKYGYKKLHENGILPWQILKSYTKLVNAFKQRDSIKILVHSAYLGHYIADAHVPLHTTANHNGQLSNQVGIHAFWESRLPELFAGEYNFITGRAKYIEHPLAESWKIITHTHQLVDTVLSAEAELNKKVKGYQKYSFSERNNQVTRQYSEKYSRAYQRLINNMVEKQMRASILSVGSFWYSAWVDAGQPVMEHLIKTEPEATDKKEAQATESKYKKGQIIGREY
ncbi:zinc dependent phospholipase C family protein [Pedobacter sp. MC2016-14]|uniref:zinc dependent phospholipase C family protein n=1 Tax=Pedobacter sp. MC2016-14 TaxID=2897327 RepID=UPI001E3E8BBE|nr:zinc dependent phospholipase C family protein [Pedobacter sp. MC2016-14]MCD0488485.1 zinc dependent phospholipase C family protein [Pedobacter sp. MC2016-14]